MHWIRNTSLHLVILVATVGLCLTILTGQIITKKLLFTHISIEDGLSQGMITDIIQDRYGFMWFSTKDGLNQYDGYRFTVYRHNPDEASSLSDSHTTALLEDKQGRIWVGTVSGRVDFFDRITGRFSHAVTQGRFATSGPANNLEEDRKGNIHALIGNTIIEINGKTDSIRLDSLFLQKLQPGYLKHITRIIESPSRKQYLLLLHGGMMIIKAGRRGTYDSPGGRTGIGNVPETKARRNKYQSL